MTQTSLANRRNVETGWLLVMPSAQFVVVSTYSGSTTRSRARGEPEAATEARTGWGLHLDDVLARGPGAAGASVIAAVGGLQRHALSTRS